MENYLMIFAVLFSPFVAVYVQSLIERRGERRAEKLWIFKTLMSTRVDKTSHSHVQALNMIDLEFTKNNKNEKLVRDIWREYLDHLGSLPKEREAQDRELPVWSTKCDDYLAQLLVAMGNCLKYDFDPVYIKKSCYIPVRFDNESRMNDLRDFQLLKVLHGDSPITIKVLNESDHVPPATKVPSARQGKRRSQKSQSSTNA